MPFRTQIRIEHLRNWCSLCPRRHMLSDRNGPQESLSSVTAWDESCRLVYLSRTAAYAEAIQSYEGQLIGHRELAKRVYRGSLSRSDRSPLLRYAAL
jgi:hypothetical protein